MGKLSYHESTDEIALYETSLGKTQAGYIVIANKDGIRWNRPVSMEAGVPIIQSELSYPLMTVTTLTSNAGYTMTATQLLGGLISDTSGTGGIAAVMPTVADTVALIPGWTAGTSFYLIYRNPGNQTVTLTTDASTQWTMTGTMTIATLNAKLFVCTILTGVTGTVYSVGTFVT